MSSDSSPHSRGYCLVPAAEFPSRIELTTQDSGVEGEPSFEFLDFIFLSGRPWDMARPELASVPVSLYDQQPFRIVDTSLLGRLAAGEEVRMDSPFGRSRVPGRLRLMWGFCPDSKIGENIEGLFSLVLEFLPDAPSAGSLDQWKSQRFPEHKEFHLGARHARFSDIEDDRAREAYQTHIYRLWFEETKPPRGLRPDDELLYRAVVDNREHLVATILACQGPIAMPDDAVTSVAETALGVGMENAGCFGSGAGFMSGCHRNYREDDFNRAEDSDTWVPRALRIADLLRAAGAQDYSPILGACRQGDTIAVREMLEAGFPPNFAIYGHTTPLTEAVRGGHEALCRLLLERGADPNKPAPFQASMIYGGPRFPLSLALSQPAIAALLLDAGAQPGAQGDDEDRAPAVFAGDFASAANAAAIFQRVNFGGIKNSRAQTGTHLLDAKNLGYCRDFVPSWQLDAQDAQSQTPLLLALSRGDSKKADLLVELGASPDARGMVWEFRSVRAAFCHDQLPLVITPVQAALLNGELSLLEQLLIAGGEAAPLALSVNSRFEATPEVLDSLRARIAEDRKAFKLGDAPSHPFLFWMSNFPSVIGDVMNESEPLDQGITQILALHRDPLDRYPELVREVDLLDAAKEAGLRHGLIATFEAGRLLTAREWLECARHSIDDAKEAANDLAARLSEAESAPEDDPPHARHLLKAVELAEDDLDRARGVIPGLQPLRRNLPAEACEKASGDFDGGAARARRDAASNRGVGFDDFLGALQENLSPGSTMDLGKLLQAARATIARLETERVALMRQA